MAILRHDARTVRSPEDVVTDRQVVREWAVAGPGTADIEQALRDGHSTGGGLGLGLGGARRLNNKFDITSRPGESTRVVITRWK